MLAKSDVDVTIIDKTNHHLFQPLLYQVATGILPEGLIAPALRRVVQKQKNTNVVLGEVTDLDLHARTVSAQAPNGTRVTLPYDTLVVAAGATHAYFGHDDWAEFAPGMKTLDDARHLRNHILGAFEMAELATDPAERRACLTFVVVGAGPTGVEVVGQIAELAHRVLPGDYRGHRYARGTDSARRGRPCGTRSFRRTTPAVHRAETGADGCRSAGRHGRHRDRPGRDHRQKRRG